MAAGNIDDAQPAVSETNVRSQMNTGIVRTPVLQRVIHALNELRGNPVRLVKVNNAADATHDCSSVTLHFYQKMIESGLNGGGPPAVSIIPFYPVLGAAFRPSETNNGTDV